MTILVLVETVLLAVLSVLVAGLLRAYGSVLRRLHDLDSGSSSAPAGGRAFDLLPLSTPARLAPSASASSSVSATSSASSVAVESDRDDEFGVAHDIAGESLVGEVVSTRVVGVENDTLLLFLSSGCSSCEVFWGELARPVALPPGTRLLVVPQSARDESRSDLVAMAPPGVDVVLSSQAWRDYEVPGSPHVVFVNGRTGRVRGEGTGQSLRQVSELLARSTGDAGFVTGGPSVGKPPRDALSESAVDRELLAAGILPGDPRLYGIDDPEHFA